MIKDFFTITDDDIKYLRSHSFYVAEKLDMVYFKVELNDRVAIALKPPKFTAISDIDCITNSVNRNIRDFVFTHIMPMRQDLVNKYGPIRIGFFFAPVQQPRKILYPNSRKDTMYINDIEMLYDNGARSPFKTSLSQLLEMQIDIDRTSIDGLDIIAKTKYPNYFIKTNTVTWSNTHMKPNPSSVTEWNQMKFSDMDDDDFRRAIHQILVCQDDPAKAASMFCDRTSFFVKMPSGNPMADSEGIVIKCANKQWQIVIKNARPNIDKSTKKIYRDMVLNSLAHDLLSQTDIIDRISSMKTEYVDKISLLFKEFISVTNIFSKLYIDPDDLLPPIEGYIGEMDLSVLSDPDVKEMCETNDTYKNIIRMFLHTFTHSVMDGKFKDMTDEDRNLMNRLTIALGYRNYADIALSRTK